MAGGINIAFLSNVRDFLRGTKDVEDALEDVSDALDDVARDAQKSGAKAGDGLGDGLRDGSQAAERALEDVQDTARKELGRVGDHAEDAAKETIRAADKMEKSFRDSFDTVKSESKKAGDDVSTDLDKGFKKAGDSAGEFKDEANSTAKETAASFDGSADSITGAFQEVAANAFAGFGPAGAAAGLAAAAGIGLVKAAFEGAKEETEKARERIDALKALFDEMGSENAALEEQTRTRIKDWAGDEILKGFAVNIAEAQTKLQEVGLTGSQVDTLLRAMAGSPDDMAAATQIVNDKVTEQKRLVEDAGGVWVEAGNPISEVGKILDGNLRVQQQANIETDTQNRLLAGSAAQLAAIKGGYDNIPSEKVIDIKADASQAQAELDEFLRSNASHKVTIATGLGGSGGITRASGGYVAGAGSDIEDRVPASLSPGEFVVDAQATRQIGVGRLEQMNNGQMPMGPTLTTPAMPSTSIQIDVHPATGMNETAIAQRVAREMNWAMLG